MKNIFRKLFMTLLSLSMLMVSACADKGEPLPSQNPDEKYGIIPVYKYTFKNSGGAFPIGAWMAPPYSNDVTPISGDYITAQAYKDIADSGINAIYALYDHINSYGSIESGNNAKILQAVRYASDNNITYLARDTNNYALMEDEDAADLAEFYQNLTAYKGFGGLMVQDEPGIQSFMQLKEMKTNFIKYMPDYAFYVNMMPTYASVNQLMQGAAIGGGGAASRELYEQYVDGYLNDVRPQFFSYDFYPMMGQFPNIDSGYFENLSIVREKTNAAKIPFWTFIQATSWNSYVRISNQAEIDWQVNTSLAYGAKGIQYFCYWTPYDDAGTSPGFYPSRSDAEIGSMVSHDGQKQDMYYKVQKTNTHLNAVGSYMIDAGFAGIMQNGESPDEIPARDKIASFRQLTSVSGDNAIVGCFDYKGKTLLYVMNNSLTKTGADIVLNLNKTNNITKIQNGITSELTGQNISLVLGAGQGAMLLLNNK